ncbi:MAG: Ig-like domain-containing protein, partial [Actinomycetota bacterium]
MTGDDGTYLFAGLQEGTFTVSAEPSGDLPAHFVPTNSDTGNGRIATTSSLDHTVNIDLGFHDPAPAARDDSFATVIDASLAVSDPATGLLANDEQGNAPAVVVGFDAASANGGAVDVAADGTFTYVPPAAFVGTDTFVYTIRDASGDESSATVTIRVSGAASITGVVWHDRNASGVVDGNEAPLAGVRVRLVGVGVDCTAQTADDPSPIELPTAVDGGYTFEQLGPGCYEVHVVADTLPSAARSATHDIDGGQDGVASVEVVGSSSIESVDFGFVNLVPRAVADAATADEGSSVTISPIANDNDPEGQPLTITSVYSSVNGAAVIAGSTIVYTPAPGYDGIDWVVYTVCDPDGECSTASVSVTVRNTNDPPSIGTSGGALDVVIGEPVARLDVVDAEGDAITAQLVGGQLPNGLVLNADGTFSGVPTGADAPPGTTIPFSVELCDARGACSIVSFSMTTRSATASTGGSIPSAGADNGRLLWSGAALLLL